MTVRDIDKGWRKIQAEMSEFAKHDVIAGWIEGKKSDRNEEGDQAAGINNATLAAIHEPATRPSPQCLRTRRSVAGEDPT